MRDSGAPRMILALALGFACAPRVDDGNESAERDACALLCAHVGCAGSVDLESLERCEDACLVRNDDARTIGASCHTAFESAVDCYGALDCEAYLDATQNGACATEAESFELECPGLTFYFGE